MNEKKYIDGIEFTKVDTATFTINGEEIKSTFTKDDIEKLSKDGLLTIDINVKPSINNIISNENSSVETFQTVESIENTSTLYNKNSKYKAIFIGASILIISLIGTLFIL
ncbi:MAG: hypothetical protein ACRDD7_01745 [Peptostreptococcaceae bacterium]